MDNLLLKNNWNNVRSTLKEKYGQLSDNDLTYKKGMEEELLSRLEKKTGQTKATLVNEINKIIANLKN